MSIPALNIDALLRERAPQIAAWGIPAQLLARVRTRIRDFESDGQGGWTYEWAREAERRESDRPLLAAALWGAARFPVANTPARQLAQARQLACFLAAAPRFPVRFERRSVAGVAIHLYAPRDQQAPLVLLSGGLDTFKIELHRLALGLVRAGLAVAAIDMPGTGESAEPLHPQAEQTYLAVLNALCEGRPRAMLGISFGGHWAAKLALMGELDAAVDVGGPVGARELGADFIRNLPNGMPETLAHALGYRELPSEPEVARLLAAFSLRRQGLLTPARLHRPLLVLNGERDPYLPLEETSVFREFPRAEVALLRGLGHCAGEKFLRVAPFLITWLRARLMPGTVSRIAERASRLLLPSCDYHRCPMQTIAQR